MRRSLFLASILALAATRAFAQQPTQPAPRVETADKIVAVVGDSIILKSDIDLEFLQMRQSGAPITDSVATFKRILERRIGELVMIQAAVRDTAIKVTPEQLSQEVQREMDARRRQFGTEEQFQAALAQAGMTQEELRNSITQEISGRVLLRNYVQKVGRDHKPPPVTDADIKRYFEENKAQFGIRPATVTFSQLVLAPKPSDTARAAARAKAEEVLKKIREGGDFETLAKQYSEDPGSKDKGGDLGWFRPGTMVREFENVAFAMRPGDISGIVETPFGFHIIKVEKTKGAERQARHILIIPSVSASDADRLRATADSFATRIRQGANIDSLIKVVGDPNEPNTHVGPYPREKLPAPYNTELSSAIAGNIVGPFELPGASGVPKFAIVKVTDVRAAGEYTLDDPQFREELRGNLEQNGLVDELIRDLRKKTLIEYRIDK